MSVRTRGVAIALVVTATLAHAGDLATFVNLGFSPDARYFMFAQYGITEPGSTPYAEAFLVDVPGNRFVGNGVRSAAGEQPVDPGQSGEGVLFSLIRRDAGIIESHRIDHIVSGRLLYVLFDGDEAAERIEFRDFETQTRYRVSLDQSPSAGSDASTGASFHIRLTVETAGGIRNYTIGLPGYRRPGVQRYQIRRILLGPDGRSLVFVIERYEDDGSGPNIRYMVETLRPDR